MQCPSNHTATGDRLLNNANLYREFLSERDEIFRHKWLESEKAGKDIGFERALLDWIVKHRMNWRQGRHGAIAKPLECENG